MQIQKSSKPTYRLVSKLTLVMKMTFFASSSLVLEMTTVSFQLNRLPKVKFDQVLFRDYASRHSVGVCYFPAPISVKQANQRLALDFAAVSQFQSWASVRTGRFLFARLNRKLLLG